MADKTDKTDKPSDAPVDAPTMTSLPLDPGQLVHIMNQAAGSPARTCVRFVATPI